ncbi:type I-F CRISPR-associated endoribonuclease Cas6/Csy4 [Candidatus Enterovibrio escicola]|nr:type I-F CRISPR-associated endoribonuclease Cas6/Csy4 [Candidatus Enterovibrio escacola]
MDNYIDIVVLPDAEISSPALINNLFAKLHRALVEHAGGDVVVIHWIA